MTGYYDYVLGLIPVSLIAIAGALLVAGFQLTTAVSVGSLVAAGLVGHAMFVNAPVSPSTHTTDDSTATSSNPSESGFSAD
ncbi:hypothetical protein [Halorientalis marina]|jgi:hypothetical protein|uniref:hypothetical protein n=1 Tax=Halorientalis marina TaxID=2931976 RepID=UPI001FF4A1ED|nr:hypothetical protein [Halorientalis marina]